MRQLGDDDPAITPAQAVFRLIAGTDEEAMCTACGDPTGMHPKWWFDGKDQLVPYCADCAEDYG